jgi:hypothetical protein
MRARRIASGWPRLDLAAAEHRATDMRGAPTGYEIWIRHRPADPAAVQREGRAVPGGNG